MGQILADATRPQRIDSRRKTPAEEKAALRTIRKEAAAAGATLHSDGKGGLPSTLVLGVFRRDEWRCHGCGGKDDLLVHHKAGIEAPLSRWLLRKGKSNNPNNITTLCGSCHNRIHDKDREIASAAERSSDGSVSVEAAVAARDALRGGG